MSDLPASFRDMARRKKYAMSDDEFEHILGECNKEEWKWGGRVRTKKGDREDNHPIERGGRLCKCIACLV